MRNEDIVHFLKDILMIKNQLKSLENTDSISKELLMNYLCKIKKELQELPVQKYPNLPSLGDD